MPRAAAVLLAAALAATACTETPARECPGAPVAEFRFTGTRVDAGHPALAGLDPVPSVPDCAPPVGPPYEDALVPFDATLAADATTQAAALCRPVGIILYGQRGGSRYAVEGSTDGAVLAACSATCSAALRLVVAGDLIDDAGGGAPASFEGALVEVMSYVAGECGTCLPEPSRACAARYLLEGTR